MASIQIILQHFRLKEEDAIVARKTREASLINKDRRFVSPVMIATI